MRVLVPTCGLNLIMEDCRLANPNGESNEEVALEMMKESSSFGLKVWAVPDDSSLLDGMGQKRAAIMRKLLKAAGDFDDVTDKAQIVFIS